MCSTRNLIKFSIWCFSCKRSDDVEIGVEIRMEKVKYIEFPKNKNFSILDSIDTPISLN